MQADFEPRSRRYLSTTLPRLGIVLLYSWLCCLAFNAKFLLRFYILIPALIRERAK
jgi:hypothetical protein